PACRRASTCRPTSTRTSSCTSMALRNSSPWLPVVLAGLAAAPLAAQAQAPVRLSFAEAVSRAAGGAPAVELAGLRLREADARVRQARSELVQLAATQQAAGVSAAIDVPRARTQLVVAEGLLIVAQNERDRARIDLARALGIDPATPIEVADTLASSLGAADVPAGRDAIV